MEEPVGHERLRMILKKNIMQNTVSHATLISGPPGAGKKTWGRFLAQALLCLSSRQGAPCGECSSCRRFVSGNHPRFLYLEAKGRWLKIEQLREVRHDFYYTRNPEQAMVCMINDAEQMTAEAAASLLKILEEPPAGLYFILLSARPAKLPVTIISRCRAYVLPPLTGKQIHSILAHHWGQLMSGFPREKASLIARLCRGIPGKALALAADPSLDSRLQESRSLSARMLTGWPSEQEMLAQAAALAERDDLLLLLELMMIHLRDGLVYQLCRQEELLLNPSGSPAWSAKIAAGRLELALDVLHFTVKSMMETNANRRMILERAFILLQRRVSFA